MFGNNTHNDNQTNPPVVNDYDSALPVGGEDLLATTNPPSNNDDTLGSVSEPINTSSDNSQTDNNPPADSTSTPISRGDSEAQDNELLSLKQNALQQLRPLVGQLEQTPEEKFRTTMMMIQASDDQSMLQSAYDQAQQITDEKVKAQALLDVVNEINYFTQRDSQ